MKKPFLLSALLIAAAGAASANGVGLKSPSTAGMHFTQGQLFVVLGDIDDSGPSSSGIGGYGKGTIFCPPPQAISNIDHANPPDYSTPLLAQCSGGGAPTGWPQMQVLIDNVVRTDAVTGSNVAQGSILFTHDFNPDTIDFYRMAVDTSGLSPGTHQLVIRGRFSSDGANVTTQDGAALSFVLDPPPPGKTLVTLSSDLSGPVDWENAMVVGNGHKVTVSGSLVVKNSLVTGLGPVDGSGPGITGTVSNIDVEGSVFEDTGETNVTTTGGATVKGNEFRASNRIRFRPDNPNMSPVLTLGGNASTQKVFQGNRVAAGRLVFNGASHWLVGGDTDAESNVLMGPRCVIYLTGGTFNMVLRGNYFRHNYTGNWSQGLNISFSDLNGNPSGGSNVVEHNFVSGGSWPLQAMNAEFRYNVVYNHGHTWARSFATGASVHHNIFTSGPDDGAGQLDGGLVAYQGETGILIYNNTFDGAGNSPGNNPINFPMVDMQNASQAASVRNNLFTYSVANAVTVQGNVLYADYNGFYSPDNGSPDNYNASVGGRAEGTPGFAGHDVSGAGALGVLNGQLAAAPFAGSRVYPLSALVDESAVWAGTQKVSQVLSSFRARYAPKAGSPIIDAGDIQDNDSQGRRIDIGAIDLGGHDQDKLGKSGCPGCFGTAQTDFTAPAVSLTAPAAGAALSGVVTLTANAQDNAGGSGVALVQFLVDGVNAGQSAAGPYSVNYNTASLSNGNHVFSAKAWDQQGNSAVSATVTAIVVGDTLSPARPKGLRKR